MYKPVWDFLGSLVLVGCSLKKVQAFLNGVAMVFFQEAIWFWLIDTKPLNMLSINYLCKWIYSLGLLYYIYVYRSIKKVTKVGSGTQTQTQREEREREEQDPWDEVKIVERTSLLFIDFSYLSHQT